MREHADDRDDEPIFAPLIRCEATLHLAPRFQYLDSALLGEAEPWKPEPMCETQQLDLVELFWLLFNRPGMMAPGVDNLGDLILFARGVCFGLCPRGSHACRQELEFNEFVHKRFQETQPGNWWTILHKGLGERPYLEALREIVQLLSEWKALRAKS